MMPPLLLLISLLMLCFENHCSDDIENESIYKLKADDIRGKSVDFSQYQGKVLLIVNVATYCGFTSSSYPDLVKMQDILGHDNLFFILGFPCNQFGEQEPDSNREIEQFVSEIYKVNFPMFSKVHVIGENAHPLFKFLNAKTTKEPDWNFWKFLVDHKGQVIDHWEPEIPLEEIFPTVEDAVHSARNDLGSSKQEL